jgi:hypothetical protein
LLAKPVLLAANSAKMKKSTDDIPEFKTGKRSKWPNKVEPLPGVTRRAPPANPPAQSQPAATESQEHAPAEDPEARRIADELVKLYRSGAIKSQEDAEFYANLIRTFDATYTGSSAGASAGEHPVDLVPEPPDGISPQERMEFYAQDLADAFGEQYTSTATTGRRLGPPEAQPGKRNRKGKLEKQARESARHALNLGEPQVVKEQP